MTRRILWPLLLVSVGALAGCTSARGTMTAIDAAHRGVVAEERIVEAYHQAVMESFGHARAAHVIEAKHIVDRLAAQEQLTADVVKEGFDRLLANLDQVEARRAKFHELYRLARQNNAAVLEALRGADSLTATSAETQQRIEDLLGKTVERVKQGGSQ